MDEWTVAIQYYVCYIYATSGIGIVISLQVCYKFVGWLIRQRKDLKSETKPFSFTLHYSIGIT